MCALWANRIVFDKEDDARALRSVTTREALSLVEAAQSGSTSEGAVKPKPPDGGPPKRVRRVAIKEPEDTGDDGRTATPPEVVKAPSPTIEITDEDSSRQREPHRTEHELPPIVDTNTPTRRVSPHSDAQCERPVGGRTGKIRPSAKPRPLSPMAESHSGSMALSGFCFARPPAPSPTPRKPRNLLPPEVTSNSRKNHTDDVVEPADRLHGRKEKTGKGRAAIIRGRPHPSRSPAPGQQAKDSREQYTGFQVSTFSGGDSLPSQSSQSLTYDCPGRREVPDDPWNRQTSM